MVINSDTNILIPNSLEEALDYLKHGEYDILAGGTDVMVKKRSHSGLPPKIGPTLNLFHLESLQYIYEDEEGLHIGAMTRLEELLNHELTYVPLKAAIAQMASPGIRYVATLGGNIGNASPAGDTLPILYVYDAVITLRSSEGSRLVPIDEFIIGPGKTTRMKEELIQEILLKPLDYEGFYYEKVGGRRSDAISKLSFIGMYNRDKQGEVCDVRLALGAVYKTVVRNRELEQKLIQYSRQEERRDLDKIVRSHMISIITDHSLEDILKAYESIILPIDDQRSNAKYRKLCAMNLVKSFIKMIGGD